MYFRAGCMALLTAILSDSLPCLICYHDARCYTYTHSAFWSFWLYGKIQTYPLPKRYRLFSLGYPMTKYVVSVIACQTCLSYETDKPPFLYYPAPLSVGALPILSCGAFRPDRLQAFRLRCRARLHDPLVRYGGIGPPQSTPVYPILYGITCLLAPV